MTDLNIDLKIAVDGNEQKTLYKTIELTLELHQDKLNKLSQQLCNNLNKTSTPFIVIEYPHPALQNIEIFNFKAKDYQTNHTLSNNKLYQYANPKNKDTIKLIKTLEKEFQKLTKLNNSASLKLQLYDPTNSEKKEPLSILNHSKIKGHLQTDPELTSNTVEIVKRISNEFLNSPIIALLQLLETFTFKAELENIEEFPEDLKTTIYNLLDFREWVIKQNLEELSKHKGDISIHITLPKLLSAKIKCEASTLASLLSTFS